MVVLPNSFFNALAKSTIKYLKLDGVQLDEEFELDSPHTSDLEHWSLRSLDLELLWAIKDGSSGSIAPLCTSILRKCAPSLEALSWKNRRHDPDPQSFGSGSSRIPSFPKLRILNLDSGRVVFDDVSTLKALLQAPLIVLVTDLQGSNGIKEQCFQERGHIKSLDTFVWHRKHTDSPSSLDFLASNDHISKLSMPSSISQEGPDEKIIPLLSKTFSNHTSLDIAWREEDFFIPETSLSLNGTIKILEQLQLTAGRQSGWQYDWYIDHDYMRTHLGSLIRLKKLSFPRDTYEPLGLQDGEQYPAGSYYIYRQHVENTEAVRNLVVHPRDLEVLVQSWKQFGSSSTVIAYSRRATNTQLCFQNLNGCTLVKYLRR